MKPTREYERPREKLLNRGPGALTSRELTQLILGSGSQEMPVERLARHVTRIIQREKGTPTIERLVTIQGLGIAKAAQIVATIELAQRLQKHVAVSPKHAKKLIGEYFVKGSQLVYILFDGTEKSIDHRVVEIGSLSAIGRVLLRDVTEKHAAGMYVAIKTQKISVSVLEVARMIHLSSEWLGFTVHGIEVITDRGSELL